ncbi:MAG TPA: hypothetical protein VFW24_16770 [Acidimicrobiales bacterium]|nr:hypothetical protein [Acidimicrobiales bacterium]
MRRRSLLAAVGVLTALFVVAVIGPGGSHSPAQAAGAATTTPASVAPASTTPAGAAPTAPASGGAAGSRSGSSHTLTRTERALLLVTLTFLVGAGLLGSPETEDPGDTRRPAITLYDDPALLVRQAPPRRPVGEPPPLR